MSRADLRTALAGLVEAPSVSSLSPALNQSQLVVADRFVDLFGSFGASCTVVANELRPGHPLCVAEFGPGPVAAVLAGHLDTVPAHPADWHGDPWQLRDAGDRWIGLGSADMKGFFAAAAVALARIAPRLRRSVQLVASTDEESGMEGMRHLQSIDALPSLPTIIGEPTGGQQLHASKGIVIVAIEVQGVDGHASQPPVSGRTIDALRLLLERLNAFEGVLRDLQVDPRFDPPHPTLNVGVLRAGDIPNRLARDARIEMEVRLVPGIDSATVLADLRQACSACAAVTDTRIDVDVVFDFPPFSGATHSGACGAPFACEAGFFPDPQQVVIWGPGELEQAHTVDESVSVAAMEAYTDALADWLLEFCGD